MAESILFVCTANICRSPVAERIARALAPPGLEVSFSSAGIEGLVGQPIHPPMLAMLTENGVPGDDFAARQLTDDLVREADLILTMTLEHRRSVVNEVPAALRRTFTLKEFVFLSQDEGAPALPDLIASARNGRGSGTLDLTPADLEIVDPFGRSQRAYEQCYVEIDGAVRRLVSRLGTPSRL